MKQENQKSSSGDVNKKIFYVALGICLVAIVVALYVGISSTMQELGVDQPVKNQATSVPDTDNALVNANQSDIAVAEPKSNEKTASASSQMAKVVPDDNNKSPNNKSPNNKAPSTNNFIRPVEGDIINPFSNGELVKSKTLMEWRTHDGVDFQAEPNTPIKAVADGKIENIVEDAMWGVCVVISHENNLQSMYYGLKPNVPVKKGAEIKVGEIVGYVGNTAEIEIALASHLHFAMKKDGEWIDPMKMLP